MIFGNFSDPAFLIFFVILIVLGVTLLVTIGAYLISLYNDKKFVSILIDWQKYENPYSKWNEAFARFDVSPEITEKIRIVKDPETWEVVKKDETKLDERIIHLIIPTINSCLRKDWEAFWSVGTETKVDGTPIEKGIEDRDLTQELKDKNNTEDYADLPF